MFGVTVKRSSTVGQAQPQQQAVAGAGPAKRTLSPMVTGTSVLGVKVRACVCGWMSTAYVRASVPACQRGPRSQATAHPPSASH